MWTFIFCVLSVFGLKINSSLATEQVRWSASYRKSVVESIQACIKQPVLFEIQDVKLRHIIRKRSRSASISSTIAGTAGFLRARLEIGLLDIYQAMNDHPAFQQFEKSTEKTILEMLAALEWSYGYPDLAEEVLSALETFCVRQWTENMWRPGSWILEPLTLMDIVAFLWNKATLEDREHPDENIEDFHKIAVLEAIVGLKVAISASYNETIVRKSYPVLHNIMWELGIIHPRVLQLDEDVRFERLKRRIERKLAIKTQSDPIRLLELQEERIRQRKSYIQAIEASGSRADMLLQKVLLGLNQLERRFVLLPLGESASKSAIHGWLEEADILFGHDHDQNTHLAIASLEGLFTLLDEETQEEEWLRIPAFSQPSFRWLDVATLVWHLTDKEFFTNLRENPGWVAYMRRQFLESFMLFSKRGDHAISSEDALGWMGAFLFQLLDESASQSFLSERLFRARFTHLKSSILTHASAIQFPPTEERRSERAHRLHQRNRSIHWQDGNEWQVGFNTYQDRAVQVQRRMQRLEFEYLEQGLGQEAVTDAIRFWIEAAERVAESGTERGADLALGALTGLRHLLDNEVTEQWLLDYPTEVSNPLTMGEILTLLKHALQAIPNESSLAIRLHDSKAQATRRILRLLEASQSSLFETATSDEMEADERNIPFNVADLLLDALLSLQVSEMRELQTLTTDSVLAAMTPQERMHRLIKEAETQIDFLGFPSKDRRLTQSKNRIREREATLRRREPGPEFSERSLESVMMSPVKRHVLAALNTLEEHYGHLAFGEEAVEEALKGLLKEAQELFQEGGESQNIALAMMYSFPRISSLLTEGVLGGAFLAPLTLPEVLSLVWHASLDPTRTHSDPKHLHRLLVKALAESQVSQTDHDQGRLHFGAVTRNSACCDRGFLIRALDCLNGLHDAVCMTVVTNGDMSAAIGNALSKLTDDDKAALRIHELSKLREYLTQVLEQSFPALDSETIQQFLEANLEAVGGVL